MCFIFHLEGNTTGKGYNRMWSVSTMIKALRGTDKQGMTYSNETMLQVIPSAKKNLVCFHTHQCPMRNNCSGISPFKVGQCEDRRNSPGFKAWLQKKCGIRTVVQQEVPEWTRRGIWCSVFWLGCSVWVFFFSPSHFNVIWQNQGSQEWNVKPENPIK